MSEDAEYDLDIVRKEEAAFRKYAAMRMAGEDTISVPKIYVDMTDDLEAALVLDEIIFWTLPKKKTGRTSLRVRRDGKLWLVVSRGEWWERKRIGARQADRAIEKLESLGLVEKEVHRFNNHPQTHLRVIAKTFFDLLITKMQLEYEDANLEETDMRRDIEDLYEMMGLKSTLPFGNLPNGNLRNGDGTSPNGDLTISPNGENINSPKSLNQSSPEQPKKDFVDGMIELSRSSGMTKANLKEHIASRIKVRLNLNPSGKDAEAFIEYAALCNVKQGWDIDKFLDWWLIEANGGKRAFWSFKRMEQFFDGAFAQPEQVEADPEPQPEPQRNYAPHPRLREKNRKTFEALEALG